MKRTLTLCAVLFCAAMMVRCSYVMDSIEGAITNRASFSIDGTYDASTRQITLNWPEAVGEVDDAAFAGYEVYITSEIDNEYSGYEVLASPYVTGATNDNEALLRTKYTTRMTLGVPAGLKGIYFFRVGIIGWDEDNSEDRIKNWNPSGVGYWGSNNYSNMPANNPDAFYNTYTGIDKVSGYVMVEIP